MLYRFDIYLCKINMELQAYLIMGISMHVDNAKKVYISQN